MEDLYSSNICEMLLYNRQIVVNIRCLAAHHQGENNCETGLLHQTSESAHVQLYILPVTLNNDPDILNKDSIFNEHNYVKRLT